MQITRTHNIQNPTARTYMRTHAVRRRWISLACGVALICVTAIEPVLSREPVPERFAMALSAGELTLDPVHAFRTTELQIATGIYEGLVSYDPRTLRPIPGVAYRWEISEDRLTYRFFLRERARFSNGDPVTAEDFRESWFRVIDPEAEGEYSFFFDVIEGVSAYRHGEERSQATVGIGVEDTHTLVVELERPASHFLAMMCHMTFAPVHESHREMSGWESGVPLISNGPYALAEWADDGLELERNRYYWDVWNVAIPEISISFGVDRTASTDLLNRGELDWALTAETESLVDPGIIQVAPLFATSYLYFRSDEAPWSDDRVRNGLAALIPWTEVRNKTTNFAAETLVPALGFYPEVAGRTEADLDAGRELLAEAGYPEGAGLPPISIIVVPGSVAEAAAAELEAVWEELLEVEVEIERVGFDGYQRRVKSGGFTMGASTWIGDFADPLAFLQMWTAGSNLNDARSDDRVYDELVFDAMGQTGESRFETLSQAETRLLNEAAVVLPLSHSLSINFIDLGSVAGWYPNALDVHPLKYFRFRAPATPRWYAEYRDAPAVLGSDRGIDPA